MQERYRRGSGEVQERFRRVWKEAGLRRGDATTAAKLVRRGGWEEGNHGGGQV